MGMTMISSNVSSEKELILINQDIHLAFNRKNGDCLKDHLF